MASAESPPESPDDSPYDPGLQAERTLLAWRRTILSLVICCAAGIRLAAPLVGVAAVVFGAAGVVLALVTYVAVRRRYRQTHEELTESGSLAAVSSWPLAALAAVTLLVAVLAVSVVVAMMAGQQLS